MISSPHSAPAFFTNGVWDMQSVVVPLYSILSHEAPGDRHSASVGLRNAMVRLGSIVTPALMGIIAEAWGIEASFYVIGVAFLLVTAVLALATRKIR